MLIQQDILCLQKFVNFQVRVENIKDPADYVPAVLEKVKPEYISNVYGLSDWTDANDFITKMAVKCGKLLKVMH